MSRVSTDVVTRLDSFSRPGFSTQVFPNGFYLWTLSWCRFKIQTVKMLQDETYPANTLTVTFLPLRTLTLSPLFVAKDTQSVISFGPPT